MYGWAVPLFHSFDWNWLENLGRFLEQTSTEGRKERRFP